MQPVKVDWHYDDPEAGPKRNFDGVIDLRSVYRAPIVATNGHYLDVSGDAYRVYNTPEIYDYLNRPVAACDESHDPNYDRSWVAIDKQLGITL